MAPPKTGKPRKVPVRGNPLAIGFYGKRGQKCIGYQIPARACGPTEAQKNSPMAGAGTDYNAVGRIPNLAGEIQRHVQWGRRVEYPRMGENPEASAKNQIAHAITGIASPEFLEPHTTSMVAFTIWAMRVDQDVGIHQYHGLPSI